MWSDLHFVVTNVIRFHKDIFYHWHIFSGETFEVLCPFLKWVDCLFVVE